MRILHTSDWHLGRSLEGRSRLAEQAQFLDELCEIASAEAIELVIIAGDIFDTYNPSAEAEELFYDSLRRLSAQGRRSVVAISGNHDSPDRVHAANPLALTNGVALVGYPGETVVLGSKDSGANLMASGKGWLQVGSSASSESAMVYTLPYPSESRLNEILSESLSDELQQEAYDARVRQVFTTARTVFQPNTVNVIASHLFVAGGWECDSERPIQLGGSFVVNPSAFPGEAQYVALGHLHRPQAVGGAAVPCRYSGSPLAYSFSEANQQKEVVIIDVKPGCLAMVSQIKLSAGKMLKRWTADRLEQVSAWCDEPQNYNCWIDLQLNLACQLTTEQIANLRRIHPGIVKIRVNLPQIGESPGTKGLSELSLAEQFKLFCLRRDGIEPEAELIDLFLELAAEPDSDVVEGGEVA